MPGIDLETAAQLAYRVRYVAGVDEAGRGAIAGPVFAAAVVLPLDRPDRLALLHAVNDSKQLLPPAREALYAVVVAQALTFGIGHSSAAEIDRLGIIPANRLAMMRALAQLDPAAQCLLLDGRERLPRLNVPQQSVIRGDSLSLSIAAASILAKVSRDRYMVALGEQYPAYQFHRHKGYCTRAHELALQQHGPCPIHRHTFAPIRQPLL